MKTFNVQANQYQVPLYMNSPMTPSSHIQKSPQNSAIRYKNFAKQSNENLRVISCNQNQPPFGLLNLSPQNNFNRSYGTDTPIIIRTSSIHSNLNKERRYDRSRNYISPALSPKIT